MSLATRYAIKLGTLAVLIVITASLLYSLQHRHTVGELRTLSTKAMGDALTKQMTQNGQAFARSLASSLFEPVALDDFEQIANITSSALNLPVVRKITVFDSLGQVINDGTLTVHDYGTEISPELRRVVLENRNELITSDQPSKDVMTIATPILVGSRVLGGLSLDLATEKLRDQIAEMRVELAAIVYRSEAQYLLWAVMLGALLSCFGAAVGALIARRMSKPIGVLTELTRQVAAGDYRIEPPPMPGAELNKLAQSLKAMASRLDRSTVSTAKLEQQVRERTQELRSANAKLETQDTARRAFLSDVSHELRTPLTALRGVAEVAVRKAASDEQTLRDALERITGLSRQAARLVDDLLFIARSDGGEPDLKRQPTPLIEPLAEACEDVSGISGRDSIAIDIDERIDSWTVDGDHQRLRQLFTILLDNAVKYSEHRHPIGVRLAAAEGDQCVEVTITDHGIGMSSADFENAFQRFARAGGAREKNTAGLGLGLSIAKAIATAHQASLDVRSRPGDGTTIRLRFPCLR